MKLPISKRLQCCAEQVLPGARVADVGCDHGYLGISLLLGGRASFIHATDLRELPLRHALQNALCFGTAQQMRFTCAPGLSAVSPDEVDTIICAGMGGDLIAQILRDCPWLRSARYHLILQPQSSGNDLRRKLYALGFGMERETLVEDGGFLYTVLCARFGNAVSLTPGQQYCSPQLLQSGSALLPVYLARIFHALTLTVEGLRRANDPTAAKRLAYYETALREVSEMRDTDGNSTDDL